jgi:hypothetical protein
LAREFGFNSKSKPRAAPWDRTVFLHKHPLQGDALRRDLVVSFNSNCMRFLYFAIDRPEVQFTAKEVSRCMANPTENGYHTLKQAVRFVLGAPRVVWCYPRQLPTNVISALTDSNWAACPVTRKSTSCSHMMLGSHPIFAGNSTQTIISLSSGEAEFYAGVRTVCRLLGLKSLIADLGRSFTGVLVTDSTAAKGLASRRGAGNVRHIHCPALWVQGAVARKQFSLKKRAGKELSADIGTKATVSGSDMWNLLGRFGCRRATGRSAAQPLLQ